MNVDSDCSTPGPSNLKSSLDTPQPEAPELFTSGQVEKGEVSTAHLCRDVGHFIGQKIDDFTKHVLLEDPWKPTKDYKFPFSS